MRKLVIIPSDPIHAYEEKGTSSWLKDYFNPKGFFDEVYVLSPKEFKRRNIYGLQIIPVSSSREYQKKLREINPICVRSYGGYWATDYAILNKIDEIPVLSSVHDTNPDLIHSSLRFSDKLITMSEVIKKILIKNKYGIEDDIFVLGNRVDLNIFRKIDKSNFEIQKIRDQFPKGRIILHVGRVSKQKNIETVIKSLKFLGEKYFFVHIGKGEFKELEILAKELNVEDRVFNISKIENNELSNWYNAADVVCIPSRWEGFGLVFIEAAACESKIVTSDIAPMNEFLTNDFEMNFLVKEYENPERISEGILELFKNNNTNKNTLKLISTKFSKEIVSDNEIDQYIGVSDKRKHKTIKYYLWKFSFLMKQNKKKYLKLIIKLPKRVWRKILSYL